MLFQYSFHCCFVIIFLWETVYWNGALRLALGCLITPTRFLVFESLRISESLLTDRRNRVEVGSLLTGKLWMYRSVYPSFSVLSRCLQLILCTWPVFARTPDNQSFIHAVQALPQFWKAVTSKLMNSWDLKHRSQDGCCWCMADLLSLPLFLEGRTTKFRKVSSLSCSPNDLFHDLCRVTPFFFCKRTIFEVKLARGL